MKKPNSFAFQLWRLGDEKVFSTGQTEPVALSYIKEVVSKMMGLIKNAKIVGAFKGKLRPQ